MVAAPRIQNNLGHARGGEYLPHYTANIIQQHLLTRHRLLWSEDYCLRSKDGEGAKSSACLYNQEFHTHSKQPTSCSRRRVPPTLHGKHHTAAFIDSASVAMVRRLLPAQQGRGRCQKLCLHI